MKALLIVALLPLALGTFPEQTPVPHTACNTYYVDQNATDAGHDGLSWCSAFLNLSDALSIASSCDTIRVADGVYTPSTQGLDNPRDATFDIVSGITLEGGYQGCGADHYKRRNVEQFVTLLSGDLNEDDNTFGDNSENAYHIIYADGALEAAIIDGFSISGGNANGNNGNGGGLFAIASILTLSRCNIFDNQARVRGGGLYYIATTANILDTRLYDNVAEAEGGALACFSCNLFIQDSEISSNEAINGGGINFFGGTLTLDRVVIRGNRASELTGGDAGGGGGLKLFSAFATINNSLLVDNVAAHAGAVFLSDHHLNVTNSTIVHNTASNQRTGGGFLIQSGTMDIANSIVWGNRGGIGTTLVETQIDFRIGDVAFSHNDIEGWGPIADRVVGGIGGVGTDPRFIDDDGADNIPGTSDDDFRLRSDSPCINRGDPTIAQPVGTMDLYGNARSVGCRTDLGAYESTKINIDNDYDSDDKITLADFAKLQLFWEAVAGTSNEADAYTCVFDTSSDGAVNLADLPDFIEELAGFLQSSKDVRN